MIFSSKIIKTLLLAAFIIPFYSFSQRNEMVSQMSTQLVRDFNEFHIKPRKIDDQFGRCIHELLLNSIDDEKVLFTKENVAELALLAVEIDEDISTNQLIYLNRFKEILKEAVNSGTTNVSSYFSQKTNLLSVQEFSASLNEDFADKANHKKKWNYVLRNQVLNRLVDDLSDKGYIYHNDSISMLVKQAEKSIQSAYLDYLKNLGIDEVLNEIYLNAIAETYDPHSSFFSPEKMNQFQAELTSEREIFGVNFNKNRSGDFEITNVYPGSSAWLSGEIHEGDILLCLKFGNGIKHNLEGLTLLQVNNLFAENKQTVLELTVKNNQQVESIVILEKGKVYSDEDIVKTAILQGDKKIGYISLPDFYTNETDTTNLGCANDIAKAIIKMKLENIEGLILDLRNNGGGSLREAIDLSGIFIDYGPILINCDEEENVYSLKDMNRGTVYRGPLVVMINQYSASASEIVAASLQDYNRALIVGQTSYGKATAQFILPLDSNRIDSEWGYIKITNLGLYRVDLTTNQKRGVLPDIRLEEVGSAEFESEKSYANAIVLDSISKKIYYTPLPKLEFTEAKEKSHIRQNQSVYLQKEKEFNNEMEELVSKLKSRELSLDDRLEIFKQIESRWLVMNKNETTFDRTFEIAFLQKDNDIYSMSPFLGKYREHFKEKLEVDYGLIETYSILLDYIK